MNEILNAPSGSDKLSRVDSTLELYTCYKPQAKTH